MLSSRRWTLAEHQPVKGYTERRSQLCSRRVLDLPTKTALKLRHVALAEPGSNGELSLTETRKSARMFQPGNHVVPSCAPPLPPPIVVRHVLDCTHVYHRAQAPTYTKSADASKSRRILVVAMDLLKRLNEVQELAGWSDSEWSRRAGLAERTHVSTLKRRLRENPNAGVDINVLAALADAADVSLDWLALGRGVPKIEHYSDPTYPGRATAVAAAKIAGFSDSAIEAVVARDVGPKDPGTSFWLDQIMALHELERHQSGEGSRQLAAGNHGPPQLVASKPARHHRKRASKLK